MKWMLNWSGILIIPLESSMTWKNIFLFTLVSIPLGSMAQDSIIISPKKYEQTVEFSALGFLNSNTVHNDFVKAFYLGKFIDEDLKFSATRRMKESNLLGGMARTGFTYTSRSTDARNTTAFSVSLLDRTHVDLKFSEDMFNLVFYGNKMFAGQTAKLGDFALNFLRYQQFRLGWYKKGDHAHGGYGYAVSLLSGEQNITANMPRADLFTAADGTFMDLDIRFDVHRTDTAQRGYMAQNGMGLSVDLFYEMPYVAFKRPGKIRFDLRDLGFIKWNNNSMHYSAGSTYHYDGVEVDDIFHLDSTALGVDNLIDKNTALRRTKYLTDIPGSLDVHTKAFYGRQIAFEKGFTWRFHTSAKMYYYGKVHFLFGRKQNIDIAILLGYGDYGRFNSGLDLTADIGKHYTLQFINYYLFSDVTAQSSTGMGMFFKLLRKF